MTTKELSLPKAFPMHADVAREYSFISKVKVGDAKATVLTAASKEHALPQEAVSKLNDLIEGDAAATICFDQCAWWFQATGMEGTAHFFKLLAGVARASACQTADWLIKRGAMPMFGSSGNGSIPVVSSSMFSSSTHADITHAATLALAMAKTEFSAYNGLEAHASKDAHLSDYVSNKARACSEKCRSLGLIVEHCKTCSEVTSGGGGGVTAAHLSTKLLDRAMLEETATLAAAVGAETALPNRFCVGAFERANATASWAAAKPYMKAACGPLPMERSIVG